MLHLACYYGAVTDSSTYAAIPAIADQGLGRGDANTYILPQDRKVVAAAGWNDTIAALRINAPSLRNIGYPEVYPTLVSATPTSQLPVDFFGDRGPIIRQNENVGMDISNGASTVDTGYGFLWLQDKFDPAPPGQIISIRSSVSITHALGTWVLGTPTFAQTLPNGQYAVVGMAAWGTALAAVRVVFPGSSSFRPGVIGYPTYGNVNIRPSFRAGEQGSFGTFYNTAMPQIEALGTAAGAQTVNTLWDLIKIG